MIKQEMHVVVMPDGSLQPEWVETNAYITQSSELVQAEIFQHFSATPASWLLFLGFCDPRVALSPSLSFFRRFSGRFIRKLTRTPDLETLRDKVAIDESGELIHPLAWPPEEALLFLKEVPLYEDAILTFDARLMLGDVVITKEEALKLLEESAGLSYIPLALGSAWPTPWGWGTPFNSLHS